MEKNRDCTMVCFRSGGYLIEMQKQIHESMVEDR